jgi:hypothetical protein
MCAYPLAPPAPSTRSSLVRERWRPRQAPSPRQPGRMARTTRNPASDPVTAEAAPGPTTATSTRGSVVASRAARIPAAPGVEQIYTRTRALCAQVGETPQRLQMLLVFSWFPVARGALSTTGAVGEALVQLAQCTARPTDLLTAHGALGNAACLRGASGAAQPHGAPGRAWLDPPTQRTQVAR